MRLKTLISASAAIVLLAQPVFAQVPGSASIISAFQQYRDIAGSSVASIVPTVVDVPFDGVYLERSSFAVYDTTANAFEPSYFMQTSIPKPVSASSPSAADAYLASDGSDSTYASFEVPGDRAIRSSISLHSSTPITASALTFTLDANVALPNSIAIHALSGGTDKVVLANTPDISTTVRFPQTTSSDWTIELMHVQPLRIAELRLAEYQTSSKQSLRFLAQPGHSYRIYFNPDRSVSVPVGESGNLSGDRDVKRVTALSTLNNSAYVQADIDGDSIPDVRDNCVSIANQDQMDVDGNGLGDVCQDFDRDGIPNVKDNCENAPNVNQADADGDGIGDVCDGEESRITEKYKWIQWAGIGFAALVIVSLFALTIFAKKEETPPSSL